MTRIETRAVLAGAYRDGARAVLGSARRMLTHAAVVDGDGVRRVLCGRVKPESLADAEAADTTAEPSCERCAKARERAP